MQLLGKQFHKNLLLQSLQIDAQAYLGKQKWERGNLTWMTQIFSFGVLLLPRYIVASCGFKLWGAAKILHFLFLCLPTVLS